jgi:integrase
MPRLVSALPKYRKHKATGKAVVTINGHDHYLGPHGSKLSRMEYDRIVCEFLATGRRGTSHDATAAESLTVTQLIAAYWKFAKGYYRKGGEPTSELSVIKLALRDLKTFYGRESAEDFGPLKLKAIRELWITKGHKRKTINDQCGRIKRVFRWAVSEELVSASCYQALASVAGLSAGRTSAKESSPVKPVAVDVVQRTLPHLSPVVASMVQFQLLTGCRPAEVCKIRPADVDRSNAVWEYKVPEHKTEHHGRDRIVYIGPEAQKLIAPYLLRDTLQPCFSPKESAATMRSNRTAKRTTPLSCGNRAGGPCKPKPKRKAGDQYVTTSYARAITRACDLAFPVPDGLSESALKQWQAANRWSPNQLRHTAATEIRRRFGLEAAQVILGHAEAKITEIYAERDADKAREVAKLIG